MSATSGIPVRGSRECGFAVCHSSRDSKAAAKFLHCRAEAYNSELRGVRVGLHFASAPRAAFTAAVDYTLNLARNRSQ